MSPIFPRKVVSNQANSTLFPSSFSSFSIGACPTLYLRTFLDRAATFGAYKCWFSAGGAVRHAVIQRDSIMAMPVGGALTDEDFDTATLPFMSTMTFKIKTRFRLTPGAT